MVDVNTRSECDSFLLQKRGEVISYVRDTWLEFLFGEPICHALNFARVSELDEAWKKKYLRDAASRHAMRKAYALGHMRWFAPVEASEKFGEATAEEAVTRLFPANEGNLTIEEILPVSQFGKLPLGESSDHVWTL